ncbi:hypothetical protein JHK82_011864 [Glycine max]|nr:hypothetical protein JHK82_011864 [Glycine max]
MNLSHSGHVFRFSSSASIRTKLKYSCLGYLVFFFLNLFYERHVRNWYTILLLCKYADTILHELCMAQTILFVL